MRKQRADTLTLVGRAGSARALSVATIMAGRKEAFPNAGALASAEAFTEVEEEVFMGVAGVADRSSVSDDGIDLEWRETICSEER